MIMDKNNRQNLQHAVRFFETLLRASSEGILITDSTKNIIFVNDTFCKFISSNRQDVIETNLFMWLAKMGHNAKDIWKGLESQINEHGIAKDVEFAMKAGEVMRYFSVNSSLLEKIDIEEEGLIISIWHDDTQGKLAKEELQRSHGELEMRVKERTAQLSNTNIELKSEITKLKKMEGALQESERKYRRLFDYSNEIIVFVDKFGKVLAVNNRLKEILGFMPEEVIGKYFFNLGILGIKELPDIVKMFKKAVVEGRIKDNTGKFLNKLELNLRAKNGDLIFVETSTAILKKDGKIEGFLTNIRDISERKQATEKLKASEKKYSTLVEKGNDGIVIIQDHLLKFINPTMAEISSFGMNEVIGKPFIEFVSLPFRKFVNDMYLKRIAGEEIPNKYEVELISKHGKIIPVEINASLIEYEGKPADMAIIRDITERKLVEKEIKKSLKEKEMLLSEIYHRVKNNMQIITSLLRLQSRHVKEEKYREMFKESQNRILSMSLVHEKLYQSKDLTQIDFNEYISDLIKGLFQSYGANKGNIVLKIDVKTILLGIDHAIPCGLIINELVTNSLKYAFPDRKDGEIKVILRSTGENMIELTVGDNGIGIPEDMDFKQTKTLGLHLVTMLAENQLHGDIKLNRSKGTEFIIKFK
jgi:PAS domain S-box-containing protein